MPAETDVINAALRKIGGTDITSLTDGTKNANIAADLYEETRDGLLRSHPWNFATRRASLAQISTTPAFEFDFAHAVPADWLRTVSVHDNDAGLGSLYSRMENMSGTRAILSNSDTVYMRYVAQVTDTNAMTADFRAVLETMLAREFALPVASSNTMHGVMDDQLRPLLAKAQTSDAQGSSPERRPRGSWANSRGGAFRGEVWPR